MEYTPSQAQAIEKIKDWYHNDIGCFWLAGGAGSGKALSLDTKLATPTGWTTMGDVQVGDTLFDENGQQTKVVAMTEPMMLKAYDVKFNDGSILRACENHQWVTITERERAQFARRGFEHSFPENWSSYEFYDQHGVMTKAIKPRTTLEIKNSLFRKGTRRPVHYIPTAKPIKTEQVDLPIHPWILGYWLGNGDRSSSTVSCDIRDEYVVKQKFIEFGYTPNSARHISGQGGGVSFTIAGLVGKLRDNGLLQNKHIPKQYLRASEMQRRQLIAGFLDSDGSIDEYGHAEFSAKSELICDQVAELMASIGQKSTKMSKEACIGDKSYGIHWRLYFNPISQLFYVDRKAARYPGDARPQVIRSHHRVITEIEYVGKELMKCVEVDSKNHMYLAGSQMIPTHNSTLTPFILKELGLKHRDVLICAPSNKAKSILIEKGFDKAITVHKAIKTSFMNGPGADRYRFLMAGITDNMDQRALKVILDEMHELTVDNKVYWDNGTSDQDEKFKLILVDEVSMLAKQDMEELLKIGCPVLAIGDNFQLPAVGYEGFTDHREPDFVLTENMRQIGAGGNIIKASFAVREDPSYLFDSLPLNEWKEKEGQAVMRVDKSHLDIEQFRDFQFFAHTNSQCFRHIEQFRENLPKTPIAGDQMVSYQTGQNFIKGKIYVVQENAIVKNGVAKFPLVPAEGGKVATAKVPEIIFNKTLSDKDRLERLGHTGVGNRSFDSLYYSNCITIHKSQGGQWDNVGVYLPKNTYYRKMALDDLMRLKYTAITRAKKRLVLVV